MIRVGHVAPATLPMTTTTGGALQRRVVAMARERGAAGAPDDVVVYSLPDPRPAHGAATDGGPGFRLVAVPCVLPRPWRDLEFLLRVQLRLRRDGVDVVHSHAVPLAGLLLGVRTVLTVDYSRFRGWGRRPVRALYRVALRRFSRIAAVSQFCLGEFEELWGDDLRTCVIGNGVDVQAYRPDAARGAQLRQRLGVEEDEVVVLYVGRRSEQKGTDLLLDAAARVPEGSRVRLVLAGPDGDFDTALAASQTAISRWTPGQAADGVVSLGAVEDDLLPAVFNAADVAVLPTRRFEMFGMAIVEAQASGLPAVASDSQGLLETVDPQSGWWFRTGDPEDLAAVLGQAAGLGRGVLRERGLAARSFALQFSWPAVVSAYEALYG